MHLYVGTVDLMGDACPDDGEFIRMEVMPVNRIPELIAEQEIRDAKTLPDCFIFHGFWGCSS